MSYQFLPLYGDQEIPFDDPEFSKQKTTYSTNFNGGQVDKKPYIMAFEVDDPEFVALIYPGGGYFACSNAASVRVAEELNRRNVTAFVLSYRTGNRKEPESSFNFKAIIQDGIRGVQYVRDYMNKKKISDKKLVSIGFSAGGHLALTVSLGAEEFNSMHDEVGGLSSIPDAVFVGYPCTTFGEGAFPSLLPIFSVRESDETRKFLCERFTLMSRVNEKTPPTFLFYGTADRAVPPEFNAIPYYFALRGAGVETMILGFENVGHGVGLATGSCAEGWLPYAIAWLRERVL